jgi:hypothetical protein
MGMTIEIAGDLEPILKAEANKAGIDPVRYTQQLLRKSLGTEQTGIPSLSAEEAGLLNEINQGLSSDEMDLYRILIEKRQEETITETEFEQLQGFTFRLESISVRRLEALAKLAALYRIPLAELMARLQIEPTNVL